MNFKKRTLNALADMVCGNVEHFKYRTSSRITEFFQDCDTEYAHDGTTRRDWVAGVLETILHSPHNNHLCPPDIFLSVIRNVMDKADAQDGDQDRRKALEKINVELAREGLKLSMTTVTIVTLDIWRQELSQLQNKILIARFQKQN